MVIWLSFQFAGLLVGMRLKRVSPVRYAASPSYIGA
jgi:hypothetical protein